ncbi:MAG TPA: MBL fold metallo-hydrolase [Kofleriaceae bacterium]|nr:MBL fold metallo-hydrolase [Kofleriaceae bacterium]
MRPIAALMIVACAGASSSRSPAPTPGRAERLPVESLEAYALADGYLVVPNDGKLLGLDHPPSETAELLAAAGLPRDPIRLDIQCLLVKTGDRVILFDTGTGDVTDADAGHLPQSLALVHVAPLELTDIFISHFHSDHVGGLVTSAGALAFPNATIHVSAPEWVAARADPDADSQRLVRAIAAKVSPFEPGAQVLPMVHAVSTPGHTTGHSSYEIGGDGQKLFYLGDVAHHAVISVQRPEWPIQVDADRVAGATMRKQMLAKLAAEHTHVFVSHFPFPGIGRVGADGQGLVWRPDRAEPLLTRKPHGLAPSCEIRRVRCDRLPS